MGYGGLIVNDITSFQNDKRYLDMKELASERDKILDDYIDKLDRQGPPPPPTQQEGERRRDRREDRD